MASRNKWAAFVMVRDQRSRPLDQWIWNVHVYWDVCACIECSILLFSAICLVMVGECLHLLDHGGARSYLLDCILALLIRLCERLNACSAVVMHVTMGQHIAVAVLACTALNVRRCILAVTAAGVPGPVHASMHGTGNIS